MACDCDCGGSLPNSSQCSPPSSLLEKNIIIRTYGPEDNDAVRLMFLKGMLCIVPAAFKLAYYRFSGLFAIGAGVGYWFRGTLGASIAIGLSSIGLYYRIYTGYKNYAAEQLNEDLADISGHYLSHGESRHFWVAESDGVVVGCVAIERKDDSTNGCKHSELRRMSVLDTFRGNGIGFRLVQTVLNHCSETNIEYVFLEMSAGQHPALKLYNKAGFRIESRYNIEFNTITLLKMGLRIK